MTHEARPGLLPRVLRAVGGLSCAAAVGLGAYASHGVTGEDQARLALAGLFLFGHGLALACLGASARGGQRLGLGLVLLGMLLFCGSLVAAVLLGLPTRLAPLGGVSMMLGWLLWSVSGLRGAP